MDPLDEYLGNITVDNITSKNIDHYIRKDKDNHGCFIDAIALLTQRNKYDCADIESILLSRMNLEGKDLLYNFENENLVGLTCETIITSLLLLPGRECLYRLYKYGDVLVRYLEGNLFILDKINLRVEHRDEELRKLITRKRQHESKFDKIDYEVTKVMRLSKQIAKVEEYHQDIFVKKPAARNTTAAFK